MNLALAHFWRRDLAKAVAQGRRATEIYPRQASGHSNLALYAMYAGDFELARREATTALELNPSYPKPSLTLALSALAEGQPERAGEAYRKLEALGPTGRSIAADGLADLAAYEGRLADAASVLEPAAKADREAGRPGAAVQKTLLLAEVRLAQGRTPEALTAVEPLVAESTDETLLLPAARVYLSAGREPEALALADRLAARLEPDPRAYALLVRGEAALGRGAPREAIPLLRESLGIADSWLGRFLLARAYVETEAFVEAHSELELLLKRRGEAAAIFLDDVPTFRHFPPVHYYLGRVLEALGSPNASASYQAFLEIKAKADPGAPLVEEARKRLSGRAADARAEKAGDRPPRG
jgi:tetratricopeptide (TPR) repeat protein